MEALPRLRGERGAAFGGAVRLATAPGPLRRRSAASQASGAGSGGGRRPRGAAGRLKSECLLISTYQAMARGSRLESKQRERTTARLAGWEILSEDERGSQAAAASSDPGE